MEVKKAIVSWRNFNSLCNKVVKQLKDKFPNIIDYNIIGLSRGGLIPAVVISNILNIRKVYSLGLKSYNETNKEKVEIYQIPDLSNMDKILLIDDISDTGESFNLTKEMMQSKDVITASLYVKQGTKFMPEVYGKCVLNDVWVVFPWE